MRLLLVRHAEARRHGRADHGLTPAGTDQARRLAQGLKAVGVLDSAAALIASPLPRAQQTAEAIAAASGLDVLTRPDLCEMGDEPSIGEGEEFAGFLRRVDRALSRLASDHAGETVVVVTHAGFIVAAVVTRLAVPVGTRRARLEPANVSVTELQWDGEGWLLASYNSLPG